MGHGGRPWVSDYNHPNYQAAKAALNKGKTICISLVIHETESQRKRTIRVTCK